MGKHQTLILKLGDYQLDMTLSLSEFRDVFITMPNCYSSVMHNN